MPIYEFYCPDCHMLFSFLSRRVDPARRPDCPRCGRPDLERRPSTFAVGSRRGEDESDADDPLAGLDEQRVEQALATLEREAGSLDEEDPRQAARLMRRLTEMTGLPLGEAMEEALRRMEAGEDPEEVEEQLGDALEDPFDDGARGTPRRIADIVRRRLPPRVDPKLYELS
ncbi:MAG: zinc ribbon domain-containing protein [Acidobacteriota bacterium]|nr:MAG: zinc ribbon domain-containing protein [Acidobacteriota bacterium]